MNPFDLSCSKKRMSIEINQLQKDIKRIKPSGQSWCTFGDLFTDGDVQQYYEALVNTLKSAKRKKVIDFKGQFLLKGMHDNVIVKVVDDNTSDDDVGIDVNSPLSNNSVDDTIITDRESTKFISPNTKLCTPRKNFDSSLEKDSSRHSIPYVTPNDTPNDNEITDTRRSITSSNTMSHSKDKDMTLKSSTSNESCRRSFASLSISQSERQIQSSPIEKKIQNNDIQHIQTVGTTFISTNNSVSNNNHDDRIEREIKQLVKDIRRIEPHGENFCTFGVLFDDPDVEQYYEALVGTLKAARRQGVISFKGQMLLKGMHDLVKINIVE